MKALHVLAFLDNFEDMEGGKKVSREVCILLATLSQEEGEGGEGSVISFLPGFFFNQPCIVALFFLCIFLIRATNLLEGMFCAISEALPGTFKEQPPLDFKNRRETHGRFNRCIREIAVEKRDWVIYIPEH